VNWNRPIRLYWHHHEIDRSQFQEILKQTVKEVMEKHDLTHLETKVKELRDTLTSAADNSDFDEFLTIIHKPGFTSVAEVALLRGVVDSMNEHSKTLLGLKHVLLNAASKVELNPQPLPP
jgi:hypothetical protein